MHYSARKRVEFYETDMAGIVHFSNYYRYMEQAEHEFLRHLELGITGPLSDGGHFGWPRVSATCNFEAPARYGDEIEIRVTVVKRSARSLQTQYEFWRDSTRLAVGNMTTVCCRVEGDGQLKAIEIPVDYAQRIDHWSSGV